jgi:hypothetical protein
MREAIPPLPQYAFIAFVRKLYLYIILVLNYARTSLDSPRGLQAVEAPRIFG